MDKNTNTFFKILREDELRTALTTATYTGSPDDVRDGFIHFSTASQIRGTLEKYFRGASVHILAFKTDLFSTNQLRWEPSRGGALFPHLYGTLDASLAHNQWQIEIATDGAITLPFSEEAYRA